jgi:hypothetical protein
MFVSCSLYVQEKACQKGRAFATKLSLAVGLLQALPINPEIIVIAVCDGAYAKQNFVCPVLASGRQVLSRLRTDTAFFDMPPVRKKGKNGKYAPGRPAQYDKKYKLTLYLCSEDDSAANFDKHQRPCYRSKIPLLMPSSTNVHLLIRRQSNVFTPGPLPSASVGP